MWNNESEPDQWRDTNIIQIYKGKGSKDDLGNLRNIHTKLETPKFFGHMVVNAAKGKIMENMSKFQLGTKPGHRAQEHLFVMRSVIELYILCGKALILQLYDISKFFDREMLMDCMDAMYNNGIKGKLYRLFYEMNRNTRIRVRTAVGTSSSEETGEGVGQGTLDGAIISACSIDNTVNNFFSKSNHEISYGDVNLQPLLFQDDIFRMCEDALSAQLGNELIDAVMETKLLDFNLDKSCYIIIGEKKAQQKIREDFSNNPLNLSGKPMKEVSNEKYLGDYISTNGLGDSVIVTINNRVKKVTTALMEVRAVVDDCRAQVTGGIVTGLEIWEMAVTPYLLNNCDTWNSLPTTALELLEDIQNQFLRNLLATPRTCPIPSLLWETGTISMKNKIIKKKLLFYHHILHLPHDSLAWQIYDVQTKLALPGLIQECEDMVSNMELPKANDCTQPQWKTAVKKAIRNKNKNDLLEMIDEKEYKKLDLDELKKENFEIKPYMLQLNLQSARTKFAIRTKMTKTVKLNFKNDPSNKKKLWMCDDCSSVDSQEHILWCPAYGHLRQEKNLEDDKDLTRYFQQVLKLRDKKK